MRFDLIIVCFVLFQSIVYSQNQIDAKFELSGEQKDITINTADNYSLQTRSAVYTFTTIPASEVAKIFQKMLSRYGNLAVNASANSIVFNDEISKLQSIFEVCRHLDSISDSNFVYHSVNRFQMKYCKASEIAQHIKSYLSADGSIITDDKYNIITITDNPYSVAKIKTIIEQYDLPKKQIIIDIEIVEIEKDKLAENGIDWDKIVSESWFGLSNSVSNLIDYNKYEDRTSSDFFPKLDLSAGLTIAKLKDIIRFMEQKGRAKILSTPKVITLSGESARIWSGRDIEYQRESVSRNITYTSDNQTRNAASGRIFSPSDEDDDYRNISGDQTSNNRISADTRYSTSGTQKRTSGLELAVTPIYGASGDIRLDIDCELTNIIGWTDNLDPIVSGQELNNSIICKDGRTILIGGLKKLNRTNSTKKVPVLGHLLPFIFSHKVENETETEVAIFLTPHVFTVQDTIRADQRAKELMRR